MTGIIEQLVERVTRLEQALNGGQAAQGGGLVQQGGGLVQQGSGQGMQGGGLVQQGGQTQQGFGNAGGAFAGAGAALGGQPAIQGQYPPSNPDEILALVNSMVDDPNAKGALQAQMQAMGIPGLPQAQEHQYGELYARFQQVAQQFGFAKQPNGTWARVQQQGGMGFGGGQQGGQQTGGVTLI